MIAVPLIVTVTLGGFIGATIALTVVTLEQAAENRRLQAALKEWQDAYFNGELVYRQRPTVVSGGNVYPFPEAG